MSRVEQDMIQAKLKSAIQNHQMLVVKLKSDNQNASFKKRMAELQEEIKRLSEEHKKIVVKVRENLVRSISQSQPQASQQTPTVMPSVGQTITAIGQPRLVSFPTQGGAAILPMGMVAVPIAHMQKPAVGMAIHPAGITSLPQATNISIIPAGLISGGCNLNFAALNGNGNLTLNNVGGATINPFCGGNLDQGTHSGGLTNLNTTGSVAVCGATFSAPAPISMNSGRSFGAAATSSTSSSAATATTPVLGMVANNSSSSSTSSINLNNFTNMTSLIINNSIGSNHPLVINSGINNKNNIATCTAPTTTSATSTSTIGDPVSTPNPNPVCSSSSNHGGGYLVCPVAPLTPAQPTSTQSSNVTAGGPSLVLSPSPFPQQPLVQPQLLQQQQQQIIQLIQQQQGLPPPPQVPPNIQQQSQLQQQASGATLPPLPPPLAPPQQRLASHLPIKVPQYTASLIRPVVNTTSVQYNGAPTSSSTVGAAPTKISSTMATPPLKAASAAKNLSASTEKTLTLTNGNQQTRELKENQGKPVLNKQLKSTSQKQSKQAKSKLVQPSKEKEDKKESSSQPLSVQQIEKIKFMKVLDLHTPEAMREIMLKRGERKRRTTANPNYSFGFEISRRDRNISMWANLPAKKARAGSNKGKAESTLDGWSDSTNGLLPQHWASNKIPKQNDYHDDYCAACSRGGSLLMCSTCRLVYHLDCLNPPLTEAPKYAWSCPQCLVSGKGLANLSSDAIKRVHSFIAKKADKEDDMKKVQRKCKEIKLERNFLDKRLQELDGKIQEQAQLKAKLSKQEQKIQEDLSKLSGFVNMIRESRSAEQQAGTTVTSAPAASLVQADCS